MIKNIIFDLDDTLYRELDFVENGFREVSDYLSNKYSIPSDEIYNDMNIYLEKYGRGRIFNLICEKYNFNEDIGLLVSIYRENKGSLKLYDYALEFILKNKKRYRFGLITDGDSIAQWNKIRLLNLEHYLEKIVVTGDLGDKYYKPDPKPYKIILDYFGGEANEFVYIGDNPKKDFITAKKLGMKTIQIINDDSKYSKIWVEQKYKAEKSIYFNT